MNDRLLRVTVILSVFALVGMGAAGTAAAQPDFNVTNLDAPQVAPFGEEIDVTVTVENEGSSSGAADVTFAADDTFGAVASGPPADVVGPSYTTPTLAPGEDDTETLTLNTSTNYPGLTNPDIVDEIFHGVWANETGSTTIDDTAEANFTVGVNRSGLITVETEDQDGDPAQTEVELFLADEFNSPSDPGPLVARGQTQLVGGGDQQIKFTDLAVGPNSNNSVDYTAIAARRDPAFTSRNTQRNLFAPTNAEEDATLTLQRIVRPDEIQVVQNKDEALGDGEDRITFNITVWGSVQGEPAGSEIDEDAEVRVGVDAARSNSSVTVRNDDTGATFDGTDLDGQDPPTFETDDGKLNLSTTSSTNQFVLYNFTTVEKTEEVFISGPERQPDDGTVEDSLAFETPRLKNFILRGEGYIIGDVWDRSEALEPFPPGEHSLPDAKVWAHRKERVTEQSIRVPPNATSFEGFDSAGDETFFRLVETEDPNLFTPGDDEILDVTQDYRIDNNGQNENLSISRVRELNTSDSSFGSGWAVRANVDNPCAANVTDDCTSTGMFVTPLEPGFYYVEASDGAPFASDQRFVDSPPDTEFYDEYPLGGLSSFAPAGPILPVTYDSNDPLRRDGNLTFERAQEISSFSGQQLWDITDENGEYVLDDMFTNFQKGVNYTVFANKVGYEIEFIDPLVTENGAFFEDGEDENFGLQPVDVDPDVNITNIARFGNVSDADEIADPTDPAAYSQFNYTDQSDGTSQVVPRDGSTVDVVLIETFAEGDPSTPVSDTVELRIPDLTDGSVADQFNFTGEWIAVVGDQSSSGIGTDTLTVTTGPDGQAIAWLESDISLEDLDGIPSFRDPDTDGQFCGEQETSEFEEGEPIFDEETGELLTFRTEVFEGIVAQSQSDAGAIDASCKDFRGVNLFESGSISGTVRNQDQGLPETVVWTREFVAPNGDLYTITPDNGTTGLANAGGSGGDSAVAQEEFTFAYYQRTGATVPDPDTTSPTTTATFTASELRNFNAQQFAPISTPPGFTEEFNFLRFPSDDPENLGDYSMDRVPAQDVQPPGFTGDSGVDYRRIQAVQYETDETGNGTSSNPVRIGFTEEGDVVIPVPPRGVIVSPDFQLSDLVPEEATVTEGDAPIDISVNITNVGNLAGTQDIDLSVNNSSGTVFSDTIPGVSLNPGDSTTETFTGVPAGDLSPGEYDHIVESDDDRIEGNLTVESSNGNGDGPLSDDNPFGDDNNDPLGRQDVITAILDWNDDGEINGVSYSREDIVDFLVQWNNAQSS